MSQQFLKLVSRIPENKAIFAKETDLVSNGEKNFKQKDRFLQKSILEQNKTGFFARYIYSAHYSELCFAINIFRTL